MWVGLPAGLLHDHPAHPPPPPRDRHQWRHQHDHPAPVLRRMAFLARSRSRLSVALGDAPVKLKVKSSCLLSWCGGMNVLAASACLPLPLPSAPARQGPMFGMAIGADVPCR